MSGIYRLIRPMLFGQDPEQAHEHALRALAWASRYKLLSGALASFFEARPMPVEIFGLKFPNPLGLAAGMDKNAEALPAWQMIGFGFTEIGAVTWHGQPGNPKPRIFRVVSEQAIINRLGFNNQGAEAVARKLETWKGLGRWPHHPVGINLGKSKITPLENAAEEYARTFELLWPYADFFVVNVSSPNTPNLRQLQDKAALNDILIAMGDVQSRRSNSIGRKPVLVKVAPDLSFAALDEVIEVALAREISGIVATNTTITRPETNDPALRVYAEGGGLSGRPLSKRSTEVIRHLYRQTKGKLPIIGVGGIFNVEDAWEKITSGAALLQVYTGLVYEGPGLPNSIITGLLERLNREGLKCISDAVGILA